MTELPEPLRLANWLEGTAGASSVYRDKAAALLRFLHKENAELRSANAYASDVIRPMEARIAALEQALTQAVEALRTLHDENMDYLTRNKLGGENNQCMVFAREAIDTASQTLGGKQ